MPSWIESMILWPVQAAEPDPVSREYNASTCLLTVSRPFVSMSLRQEGAFSAPDNCDLEATQLQVGIN